MSTYLITGGAGFIGSNFCHYMINQYPNNQFICVDALTYAGKLENIRLLLELPNFLFIQENICNKTSMFRIFEEHRPDIVIHFAAETHVDKSIVQPTLFFETNVMGTQVLLEACRTYGIQRFHFVSTDEVYGDLPLESKDVFYESSLLRPSNPYSASKASADLLVQAYYKTYHIPCTISRSANNFGPYQLPDKLIPMVIQKALHHEKIPIYGSGLNVRDWIYVIDHCRAIDLIIRNGIVGEIYNVTSNMPLSNLEVAKIILNKLHQSTSLIEFVADRPAHDLRYEMNASKLYDQLGFVSKFHFEEGIEKTIAWNIDNQC